MTLADLIELALGAELWPRSRSFGESGSHKCERSLGAGGALVAHRKALYAHSERGEAAQLIAQKLENALTEVKAQIITYDPAIDNEVVVKFNKSTVS